MMSLNLFTFCQPLDNYEKMKGYQRCVDVEGLMDLLLDFDLMTLMG